MAKNSGNSELTAETVLGWFKEHPKVQPSFACCHAIANRLSPFVSNPRPDAGSEVAELPRVESGLPVWDFKKIGKCAEDLLGHLPMIIETWDSLSYPDNEILRTRADLRALQDTLERTLEAIQYPWGKYEPNRRHPPKPWNLPAKIFRSAILEETQKHGLKLTGNNRNNVLVAILAKALKERGYGEIERGAISEFLKRLDKRHSRLNDNKSMRLNLLSR